MILLSLAGIPPLLGFVGKFLLYMYLLTYKSYLMFNVFLLFNVFILYFYIQNVRFMISKTQHKLSSTQNNTHALYEYSIAFLLCVLFFNLFGIFFFEAYYSYLLCAVVS